ncbi:PTS sugar transporter subunit IIA [Nitratidesulfovibrio oxamicus]|uniref:PTS sugar transporter subunit IIA n=1 Tax=Nitratidesulfovibrio oxamicus TaxID=32016 RepID=UPI001E641CF8|nr:PTS sugar transporter subunit IIA [Nitratidesulfovibrio oxamicus]
MSTTEQHHAGQTRKGAGSVAQGNGSKPEDGLAAAESRIGVILVTHADYGAALLRAAEFILGPVQDCASISVDVSLEVDETVKRLNEAVKRLDTGRGVMILTDMFGGTPTNLSLALLGKGNVEVLTGVNLPMLLKVFGGRVGDLASLSRDARDAGTKGIVAAGELLRSRVKNG